MFKPATTPGNGDDIVTEDNIGACKKGDIEAIGGGSVVTRQRLVIQGKGVMHKAQIHAGVHMYGMNITTVEVIDQVIGNDGGAVMPLHNQNTFHGNRPLKQCCRQRDWRSGYGG